MSLESYDALTDWERELLDCAWHQVALPEFRNGNAALPALPIEEYRARCGRTLMELIEAGMVIASFVNSADRTFVRPVPASRLREMLADGSAWDLERDPTIELDTTAAGESLLMNQ